MEIRPGTKIPKPVITQEECDAYSAVVDAINYVVVEAGTQPDPADAPKPTPTLEERMATVEAAQADADALNVDQAYRLTLLELGITE